MTVTADQITSAFQAQQQGQELKGEQMAFAGLMKTPPLEEMGIDADTYYSMDEQQQARALGNLINSRTGAPLEEDQEDSYDLGDDSVEADRYDLATERDRSSVSSPLIKNQEKIWEAGINTSTNDTDLVTSLVDVHTNRSPEGLRGASRRYWDKEAQAYRTVVEEALEGPVTTPEGTQSLAETVEALSDIQGDINKLSGAAFTAFVDAVGAVDLEPEIAREIVGQMGMMKVAAEAAEEVGIGDLFSMVARSIAMVGSDVAWDNYQISGGVSADDFILSVRDGIENLDPEDREHALREFSKELAESGIPKAHHADIIDMMASPTGRERIKLWLGTEFAVATATELATVLVRVGQKSYKAVNGLKALNKAAKEAREIPDAIATAAVSRNARAKEAIGMDDEALGATLSPWDSEWIAADSLDGVGAMSRDSIKKHEQRAKATGRGLEDQTLVARESWMTDTEFDLAAKNIEAEWRSYENVEDVFTARQGDNVVVSYKIIDEDGVGQAAEDIIKLKLNRDTMAMEFADPGILTKNLAAKGVWATGDFREVVRAAERLDALESRTLVEFRKLWSSSLEPILGKGATAVLRSFSPTQRKKLNQLSDVLVSGDAEQTVYTANQLKSGLIGGEKFDDAMVESYFKMRNVIDSLYFSRNSTMRREMDLKGQKRVEVPSVEDEFFARPLSSAEDAAQSINRSNAKKYFDDETGQVLDIKDLDLESKYTQGRVLSVMDSHERVGKEVVEVRYVLTSSDNVKDLPLEVMPRRVGYVPKINENVAYVAKRANARNLDGETVPAGSRQASFTAERFFDSKKEADLWVEAENLRLARQGMDPDETRYVLHADRQLEKERSVSGLSENNTVARGSASTRARSTQQILFGKDGVAPSRVNPFAAISRALTSTSRYVSRNEFRLGMEERFVKTANQLRKGDHNVMESEFKSFSDLAKANQDTESGRKIKAMYDAGADWMNFPSTEELMFGQAIQGILDKSGFVTKLPGMRKGLNVLRSKDPVGAARAAAFHGMLGVYNPVQWWVQAQGAAVALSQSIFQPAKFGRVMRDQTMISWMQNMELTPAHIKHVAKSFGVDEGYATDLMNGWRRSGLAEAVLMTADHAAAQAGYGVTAGALRKVADQGLWFYRRGELFNRRTSFVTAFDEWRTANPGKAFDDRALREVTNMANNFMLNMGKAQRSQWQKGIFGLAFQFQQINARTLETLLGANGNLTRAQRGKLVAGQLALYGTAGVPLSTMGARWYMEMRGIENQADLEKQVSPEQIKAINEGFLGWATLQIFGADIEIGNRSALLGGVRGFADDLIFSEGTWADKLFGAFGNIEDSFWGGLMGTYEPLSLGLAENRAIDIARAIASPVLGSISSFKNIDKALYMHHMHQIPDKNWNVIVERNFTPAEELFKAAGFRLTDEVKAWELEDWNKAQSSLESKLANEIVKIYNRYSFEASRRDLTQDELDQHRTDVALALQGAGDEGARKRVRDSVKRKLSGKTSKLNENWKKFHEQSIDIGANGVMDWHKFMTDPSGQMQLLLSPGGFHHKGDIFDREGEK